MGLVIAMVTWVNIWLFIIIAVKSMLRLKEIWTVITMGYVQPLS